jgi:hypothetical protein
MTEPAPAPADGQLSPLDAANAEIAKLKERINDLEDEIEDLEDEVARVEQDIRDHELIMAEEDYGSLLTAADWLARGRVDEALIHIARAAPQLKNLPDLATAR